MPDWTYRTILRPLLLRMPHEKSRRFAVNVLRRLGQTQAGLALLQFFGHMAPNSSLKHSVTGREFPSAVGLASLVDPTADAIAALSRFGCGVIEVGPVETANPAPSRPSWRADTTAGTITGRFAAAGSAESLKENLSCVVDLRIPVWLRVAGGSPSECEDLARTLGPSVQGFTLDAGAGEAADSVAARVNALRKTCPGHLLLIAIDPSEGRDEQIAALVQRANAHGVVIRGERSQTDGTKQFGGDVRNDVLERTRRLRGLIPSTALLVAGGVIDPTDVSDLRTAGADLCLVDCGLMLSGPGLLKRCNDALLLARPQAEGEPDGLHLKHAPMSWFWGLMLGIAMFAGGLLALAIASTRVVLPYDEALCGMTRAQLAALNPRLLPFMAHDRVSLAGVMLSIGILYSALAWHGIRRGAHWAQTTLVISATSGFFSFFLFLGFGYFDPFHAFVTAILFPMMLLCLFAPLSAPRPLAHADPRETAAWRRGQWGQLLFVFMGVGLTAAGLTLALIGCTHVFVQDDLDFLGTAAAKLFLTSDRLLPLIAHDRASLGGMLVASGLGVWLAAQWGFRRGEAWLWTTFKWAGAIAFTAAIVVHFAVDYMSWRHLFPAMSGATIWFIALLLSRDWLLNRGMNETPNRALAGERRPLASTPDVPKQQAR